MNNKTFKTIVVPVKDTIGIEKEERKFKVALIAHDTKKRIYLLLHRKITIF